MGVTGVVTTVMEQSVCEFLFDSQYVSKVGRIVDRSLAYSSPRSPKMLKLS